MVDIIRRVIVQGESRGLDALATDLRDVEAAQQGVASASQKTATVTEMSSRRQLSAQSAYNGVKASLDSAFRSQQQFARGQDIINRAFDQGIIDMGEQARMLDLLKSKYDAVGTAAVSAAQKQSLIGGMSMAGGSALANNVANQRLIAGMSQQATQGLDGIEKSTARANNQMKQLSFQLIDIGQSIPLAFTSPLYALQNFGFQSAQIGQLYAGQGGITQALKDSASMVATFVSRLAPVLVVVGAVTGAIGLMTREINKAGDAAVTFGDTALAAWQLVSEGVYRYVEPALNVVTDWFSGLWATVQPHVLEFANGLVRAVVGAVVSIKSTISQIPDAFLVAGEAAANFFIDAIQKMVDSTTAGIKGAMEVLNLFAYPGKGFDTSQVSSFEIPRVDIGGESALRRMEEAAASLGQRLQEIGERNYLGDMFDAVSERARQLAAAKLPVEEIGAAATDAAAGMRSLRDETSDAARELEREFQRAQDEAISKMDEFRSSAQGVLSAFVEGGPTAALEALSSRLAQLGEDLIISGLFGNQGEMGGGIFGDLVQGILGKPEAPVATMNVSAGIVNVGGFSLPGLGEWVPFPSNIVAPAGSAPLGAVTSSALPYAPGSVEDQVWSSFKGMGLSDAQVAGIMGNIDVESGFDPTARGDNGNAFGLFQHNGPRMSALDAFAGPIEDPSSQIAFAQQELLTTENAAFKALQEAQTPGEAARIWSEMFERPGVPHMDKRISSANEYFGSMGGQPSAGAQNIVDIMNDELAPKVSADLTQSFQQITDAIPPVGEDFIGNLGGGLSSITKSLTSLVPAGLGAVASPDVFSAISSGFGGLFAEGGTLGAGKWGIAGERGPELIHGPASVTPVDRGGAGSPKFNVNIKTQEGVTARVTRAEQRDDGEFDMEIYAEAIERNIRDKYGLREAPSRWGRV